MKRATLNKALALMLAAGFIFAVPVPAADSTADQTLEQQIETLQKENDELKKQIETLTQQLEEQEEQEEQKEQPPELPENVANADTTVQYSDKATVQLVQSTLNAAGYNCGNPDGVAGSKTTEAIKAYETAQGIVVNGVITDQLLESLGIADQLEEQAKKEAEKASYSADYTYDQLARNPDAYYGKKVKFSGKVLQVMEGDINYLRLAINSNYDTVLFVTYDSELVNYRILDDDQVIVYGGSMGVYSYESVMGATITLPWVNADMIEMK